MLWGIIVLLIILWILGWAVVRITSWVIHLLLVIAVIVLVFRLLSGRRVA